MILISEDKDTKTSQYLLENHEHDSITLGSATGKHRDEEALFEWTHLLVANPNETQEKWAGWRSAESVQQQKTFLWETIGNNYPGNMNKPITFPLEEH